MYEAFSYLWGGVYLGEMEEQDVRVCGLKLLVRRYLAATKALLVYEAFSN